MISAISSRGWRGFPKSCSAALENGCIGSSAAAAAVRSLGSAEDAGLDAASHGFGMEAVSFLCAPRRLFAVRRGLAGAGLRDFRRQSALDPIEHGRFRRSAAPDSPTFACGFGIGARARSRVCRLPQIGVGRNACVPLPRPSCKKRGEPFAEPDRQGPRRACDSMRTCAVHATASNQARLGSATPRPVANGCVVPRYVPPPSPAPPWRCETYPDPDRCGVRYSAESASACAARMPRSSRSAAASATRS